MILEKAVQQSIQSKLSNIIQFYINETEKQDGRDGISLLSGDSGIILIFSLLYASTPNKIYKEIIESKLDKVINEIEMSDTLYPTFCSGLAGTGWLLLHLSENNIIEIEEDDFLTDVDSLLEVQLNEMLLNENFDILHGAIGIGLYFVKRNNIQQVLKIVHALNNTSVIDNDQIFWYKKNNNESLVDFGLAHGNASILYFLYKCFEKKIAEPICLPLIRGNINFYLQNVQDIYSVGSYFPSIITAVEHQNKTYSQYSRLAWCYGDGGILNTLFLASQIINDTVVNTRIQEMLEVTLKRKIKQNTGIVDAGFCHGSSGVGYIFLSLYLKTNKEAFLNGALYWLNQTLDFAKENEGVEGYLFNFSESGFKPQTNILNGLGGVALFLTSISNIEIKNDWNECFFLS